MLDIKKLNKAILFVKNKDFDSAEKIYYELLRDNPNNDTVLSFWGLFNMKKGLFNKAEKILESAYKLKKAPSTIAGLAYTKYKIKKYDDAIILYEELFRYDKESEIIYQKIIECFRKLYMYDFANAYCRLVRCSSRYTPSVRYGHSFFSFPSIFNRPGISSTEIAHQPSLRVTCAVTSFAMSLASKQVAEYRARSNLIHLRMTGNCRLPVPNTHLCVARALFPDHQKPL